MCLKGDRNEELTNRLIDTVVLTAMLTMGKKQYWFEGEKIMLALSYHNNL